MSKDTYLLSSAERGIEMVSPKSLPFDSSLAAFVPFILMVIVALPLWLVMLLLALVWNIIAYPFKLCGKKKSRKSAKDTAKFVKPAIPTDVMPRCDRPYDVILYGATGFTGGT